MASAASQVVNERYAAYSASKAALSHMVRILAMEWSKSGICVNAIGPALTRTPLAEATLLADPNTAAYGLSKTPMGRLGTTMDLLGSVLLLLSPAGSFITGQTIYVDGGRMLQ